MGTASSLGKGVELGYSICFLVDVPGVALIPVNSLDMNFYNLILVAWRLGSMEIGLLGVYTYILT